MAARIAELEAQIDAVRAALGVAPLPRATNHTVPSPAVAIEGPSSAAAISVGESEGGDAPANTADGQLTVGDEPGRSTFYGSAATHYLIVSHTLEGADGRAREDRGRICGWWGRSWGRGMRRSPMC